jgi:hypothetical protein
MVYIGWSQFWHILAECFIQRYLGKFELLSGQLKCTADFSLQNLSSPYRNYVRGFNLEYVQQQQQNISKAK